jgi:hypothetical protein
MKRSVLMGCAGLAMAASAMAGPGELSSAPFSGQKYMAQRAAKVVKMADGSMRRVGEWVTLSDAGTRGTIPEAIWDASELCPRDPSGAPVGFVNNTTNSAGPCDAPVPGAGNRWFFGNAAVNVRYMADYQDAVAATDATDLSMNIWFNPVTSAGCLIFVTSWDTISLDGVFLGNGDASDGFVSGVVLDYGPVAPNGGAGYGIFGAGALPAGLITTAADLEGGFEFLICESFQDTDGDGVEDTVFIHDTSTSGIQPMLWGTGEDRVPADTTRAGTSTSIQYDDDAPLDLIWTPGFDDPTVCAEAYSYDYTGVIAPSILGASFSVYGDLASCPSADFNGDNFVDFFDYDDYVACFENGCGDGGLGADFNDDGFVDFFDYDDFVFAFEGCP